MPLVWKVVSAMVAEAGSPTEAGLLRGARKYLEHSYTNHMTATIHANRPQVILWQTLEQTLEMKLEWRFQSGAYFQWTSIACVLGSWGDPLLQSTHCHKASPAG